MSMLGDGIGKLNSTVTMFYSSGKELAIRCYMVWTDRIELSYHMGVV